ncbi:glucose 1-dehydrogenase [Spiribacter sp. C176]|uniref:Glucose 1-dehydrogenase n=1 Tax=Spiribacter salilacus TaxID=2664894 RepID=A0A6N7QPS8_9GAMM|nr:glucose 1-dehydrogenase [Spiribacter salilacus]MRH78426.1 glucose 1-dehydrogenase [Spiribacter salilacus]
MRFDEKGVVVTGGASGIGEATVRRLVRDGAKVVIADIDDTKGRLLEQEIGKEFVRFCSTDVTDTGSVDELFNLTEQFCGVDGVFNNAGIGAVCSAIDYKDDDWQRVVDINLTGVFKIARAALARMKQQGSGSIVNCASILGHFGQSQTAAYSATKGAVLNLTRTLAIEHAGDGIRVNSVSPGYVRTPILEALDKETLDFLQTLHPIGRLGEPHEIANAATFLLSDEASFITGADLLADGGFTAGKS